MGWCTNCNIYYNKMKNQGMCNNCSRELQGTPPGLNNMMLQYYNALMKSKRDELFQERFKQEANLMDLSSSALLEHPDLLIIFAEHALLRAYYRKTKRSTKNLKKEKFPMKKLFELINLKAAV